MSCEVKKEPHLQAVHARASSGHALQGDALWYRLANFSLLKRPPCKLIIAGAIHRKLISKPAGREQ